MADTSPTASAGARSFPHRIAAMMAPNGGADDIETWPARTIRTACLVFAAVTACVVISSLFVPLDEAVLATGRVSVSGARQAVQHPQGGVAAAIYVQEGQTVQKGQSLIRLKVQDLEADLGATELRLARLWSARARLHAQMTEQSDFDIPSEFALLRPDQTAAAADLLAMERQRLAADQAAADMSERATTEEIRQTQESIASGHVQRQSLQTQLDLIHSELADIQALADLGYAPITKLRSLKREAARLTGEYEALEIEGRRHAHRISELQARRAGLHRDRIEALARERQSVEAEIASLAPSLPAMRERYDMADIRSPATGRVVGLTLFTNGGVVPPGQTLMEILPDDQPLIIEAQLQPQDVESIQSGQGVEVRFTAYQDRRLANVQGRIVNLSADALDDARTGEAFFKIKVAIMPGDIVKALGPRHGQRPIRAGMPVEVLVPVKSRTAFEYITAPISDAFWRSFREH